MQLNLPIWKQLENSENILIVGAGGGFDVFAGLPLYFTLKAHGKNVHLANYTFTDMELIVKLETIETLIEDQLVGVNGKVNHLNPYFPEGYFAEWFSEVHEAPINIWMLAKTEAAPHTISYRKLVEHLGIDALILIDGGVDSLMRADEQAPGSLVEDSISLAAASAVDVPVKILACLGFGAEIEVCHHHALQNMAALIKENAFYGGCALIKTMEVYQWYEQACRYVWEQLAHGKSHISMRVVSAVNGEFGNHHLYENETNLKVFVSPLMSLYWFFDADVVAKKSFLCGQLMTTKTTQDARRMFVMVRDTLNVRPRRTLPY